MRTDVHCRVQVCLSLEQWNFGTLLRVDSLYSTFGVDSN